MSNSKYRDSSLHHFELNKLKTSANPESYIENLLLKSISEEYKGKIDLTLSELQDVLKGVGIHLTSSQSAQVYKRSLVSNKIRASTSMVTNLGIVQQNRLNFQLAAKWIHYYIGGVSTTSVLKNKSSINIAHVPSSNERGRSDIGSKVANARIYAQLK